MKVPSKHYIEACCGEHMNLLVRHLQAEMGVTAGDVAGQFFMAADNEERWLKIVCDWTELMHEYVQREALYAKD